MEDGHPGNKGTLLLIVVDTSSPALGQGSCPPGTHGLHHSNLRNIADIRVQLWPPFPNPDLLPWLALQEDGSIVEAFMPDALHPSPAGLPSLLTPVGLAQGWAVHSTACMIVGEGGALPAGRGR
jgi:hypothetical protein